MKTYYLHQNATTPELVSFVASKLSEDNRENWIRGNEGRDSFTTVLAAAKELGIELLPSAPR